MTKKWYEIGIEFQRPCDTLIKSRELDKNDAITTARILQERTESHVFVDLYKRDPITRKGKKVKRVWEYIPQHEKKLMAS
jgi:hypothetical protein